MATEIPFNDYDWKPCNQGFELKLSGDFKSFETLTLYRNATVHVIKFTNTEIVFVNNAITKVGNKLVTKVCKPFTGVFNISPYLDPMIGFLVVTEEISTSAMKEVELLNERREQGTSNY